MTKNNEILLTNFMMTNIENEKKQFNIRILNAMRTVIFENENVKSINENERNLHEMKNDEKNFRYVIFYRARKRLSLINH